MIEKENPPYAPNIVESMRSIGYSFETALADIIDNSIAANASTVEILSIVNENCTFLSIKDNGIGMSSDELFNAMRYGTSNPNESRVENDMGRFGLGLKSASLSQCRKLTVISKKDAIVCAYSWDVDHIISKGMWVIQELENLEIVEIFDRLGLSLNNDGTIVLWENFDRIKNSSMDLSECLKELLMLSIDHLSLVYHRLIGKNFKIYVNGNEILSKDPFLETNKGTQLKREQHILIDNKEIVVKPFILPHINKLSNDDIIKVGGKESLRSEQGFYIYRNKRLIIWGTWFRLGNKSELTKLARVRVDIPNNMDYLWDIDIKKSKASLPDKIKVNLYNAVLESCGISERVHEYKGRKITNNAFIRTWNVVEKRKNEGLDLEVNLQNPLIEHFMNSLNSTQKKIFLSLINDIETSVPLDYIYSQIAKGKKTELEYTVEEKEELLEGINVKLLNYSKMGMDKLDLIDILLEQEKYVKDKYIKQKLEEMRELECQ